MTEKKPNLVFPFAVVVMELFMNKVERYEKILKAAFKVKQLRYEIREQLDEIADNISAKELKTRQFEHSDAKKAFLLLGGVKISECNHVGSQADYKEINVYLHSQVGDIGNKAMKEVLSGIGDKQIMSD